MEDCTVWICDDEPQQAGFLQRLTADWAKRRAFKLHITQYHSAEELLFAYDADKRVDILLLDIQMEGMRGMEVARALRISGEDTVLIFVTARKEYAAEAYEVSAFYYLLKPVDTDKFCEVFRGACGEVRRLEDARGGQLFFQTKTRNFTLQKKEILYVESARRQVEIHTLKENITVYATMKHMEEQLGVDFCRCHRGYLVNLAYVAGYGNGVVRLQNGETVYLAREKYSEFVRTYTEYLKRAGTALV